MEPTWIVVLMGVVLLGVVQAGRPLLTELKVCVPADYRRKFVNLECPADHLVIIAQATYRQSQQPGCQPTAATACVARDVSTNLTIPCIFKLGSCQIELMREDTIGRCPGHQGAYQGKSYFHVLFKCEPVMLSDNPMSQTADMCSRSHTSGSLVYLWSPHFPQYSTERTCRCRASIGHSSEMEIKLPHFQSAIDPANTHCPQVLHFWSGGQVRSVCSETDDTVAPIELPVQSDLYIEFDNPARRKGNFWVILRVHHEETVEVACDPELIFPPRPLAPSRPTQVSQVPTLRSTTTSRFKVSTPFSPQFYPSATYRSTTEPFPTPILVNGTKQPFAAGQQGFDQSALPVVAGSIGAALLVIIIMLIIIIHCQRRKQTPVPKAPQGDMGHYAFDNNIYMTNGRRSDRSALSPGGAESLSTNRADSGNKKKFANLAATRGTVVLNPYAGIPVDSPKHVASSPRQTPAPPLAAVPAPPPAQAPPLAAAPAPPPAQAPPPASAPAPAPAPAADFLKPVETLSSPGSISVEYEDINELQTIKKSRTRAPLPGDQDESDPTVTIREQH